MRRLVSCLIVAWLAPPAAAADAWRVVTVDDEEFPATSIAIASDGRELRTVARRLPLADVRWLIANDAANSSAAGPVQLWIGEERLSAADIVIQNDRVRVQRSDSVIWDLPLDRLRAGWWGASRPPPVFLAALAQPDADRDQLLLIVNDAPTLIAGFLEAVTAEHVRLEWQDEVRTVPRKACLGFVAARASTKPTASLRFVVQLRDGSRIPATSLDFDPDVVRTTLSDDVLWNVPRADIARIGVRTERLRMLSDLTPVSIVAETIVALPRPWQRNRTVTGRPLDTPSGAGFGMQSGTSLTFDIADERAVAFAVVVGLDDVAGRNGDCLAVIRGDGRELQRQRLRGGEPAVSIRGDVTGIRRLELAVEFGENLDLGDHVNWCDARLVRPAVTK